MNKFNFSTYYYCGNSFVKGNLNFNSTTNINKEKNQNEKTDKFINNNNNSIIYNNDINTINALNSNNENIFNKNNSFTPNFNNYANANSNTTNNINNNVNQIQQSMKNVINNPLLASNNISANPNYSFIKIVIKSLKIVILKKQDMLIAGFFSHSTSSCLIKGYLLHIYVSYFNYANDIFETAKSRFKEGAFLTVLNKQNIYFNDNSDSTSPIRDRKDYNSSPNNFVINTQGNEKNPVIKKVGSNNAFSSNNPVSLIDRSNFIQIMNKKFFEVK
jgi:hypothetical protein